MTTRLLPRLALLALSVLAVAPSLPDAVALAGSTAPATTSASSITVSASTTDSPPTARVVGTRLVDGNGQPLRLLGVNKSGSEYACAQGWGIFDGPTDTQAIAAMKSWKINAVRVPMNEHCWLGVNGVATAYAGQSYREAIQGYVARLNAAGIIAVLDLHWSHAGTTKATDQQLMANADHSPAFWSSVATTFKTNPSVVFDLFNEPHDISWACWRDGCTTSEGWKAAGMQSLVDAVRGTGARQPVLLSGNNWGGDLSQWLAHQPVDIAGQTVASAHIYNFSQCNTESCWDSTIGAVARAVPVVTAEMGENSCTGDFTRRYMDWADSRGVGYLGWTWNTWDCGSGPALISANDGTPTAFGRQVRDRFAALAAAATAPAPAPTTPVSAPTVPPTAAPAPTPTPPTAAPSTPPPAAPVGGRLAYGFEVPWRAETPGAQVGPSVVAHSGAGGLSVTSPATTASTSVLRLNSGAVPLDRAAGQLVTAWVMVPATAPGSGWRAQIQVQDSGWTWRGGAEVALKPGVWTQVSVRPSSTVWAGHRSVGVQFVSTQTGSGPLIAYVDEVRQSA